MSTLTISELKHLYNKDKDFKDYVNKFAIKHCLTIEEALQFDILQGYGNYIRDKNK